MLDANQIISLLGLILTFGGGGVTVLLWIAKILLDIKGEIATVMSNVSKVEGKMCVLQKEIAVVRGRVDDVRGLRRE